MKGTIRTLRSVQWTMLGSIFLYAVVGELVGSRAQGADPTLSYALTSGGVAIVGAIFVVRRTLVFRSEQNLTLHPDDSLTLIHWKIGSLPTYPLFEGFPLFGFVLPL